MRKLANAILLATLPAGWTEDPESEETKAFVANQNAVSEQFLDTPLKKQVLTALTEFQDYPKFGTPFRKGSFWYTWRNSGLQNQFVLHRHATKTGENSQILLDPNTWTEDGTATVDDSAFSQSGSLMAYARGDKGSDWRTIYFVDTETGEQLADQLMHAKFTSLGWLGNKWFFYNKYDIPEGSAVDGSENTKNEYQKARAPVYCHKLGTPQSEDVLVLDFPSEPKWLAELRVTDDEKFLVASINRSCEPVNQVWIAQLPGVDSPVKAFTELKWIKVVKDFSAEFKYVANDGHVFFFVTNKDAPKKRIVRLDIQKQGFPVDEIVPEASSVLDEVYAVSQDLLMLIYTEDVKSRVYVHRMDGSRVQSLDIPVGSVYDVSGERKYNHFLFSLASFDTPRIVYELEIENGSFGLSVLKTTEIAGLPLDQLEVTQEFYSSKDGTEVPMFLVRKKGWQGKGPQPTLLYGYGGFNISLLPYFQLGFALFALYLGLSIAIPNIRGGGEYGLDWYRAAVKDRKQVSYDDFQSAAEYLFAKGYSSPDRLAIMGASNGGLLVAACANQRPDLFRAVIAKVGVMDLLRFNKFTIGHAWVSDYGDPDVEEDFEYISKISPLHNIKPETVQSEDQPAVLVMTADHDDRVSPFHSLKYIAELQHAAGYSSPVNTPLIAHIDTKAGHGGGKPLSKVLEDNAIVGGFLGTVLGLKWTEPSIEENN
ncbi:putative prolyl endopeptidase [Cyclospora cayetanensis]|uniref:Prolyl endopeptidase n=1 Tax=Cyclospora cayetanensis TaxID=88456 RepID=A0A1D3D0B5_9EIME|nr:putative prolyl endopeptidase [Cyclospora cayetanensis]